MFRTVKGRHALVSKRRAPAGSGRTRANPSRKNTEQQSAIESLREDLRPGDVVYTTLEHVSSSGMRRVIGLHAFRGARGENHLWLSGLAARALGDQLHAKHQGIVATGAGMDMGFDLVYRLGHALFGDGYALKHSWV